MKSNRKRIVLANSLEFVCSAMNNKVYYSENERKRIARRMFVLNNLKY